MTIPKLRTVLVAPEAEVEPLIRSARADIAMLSLQLRTALHDAELAERAESDVDVDGARELLRIRLGELVQARRVELRRAFDEEVGATEGVVAAARVEAEAIVLAARECVERSAAIVRPRPHGLVGLRSPSP